MRRLLEQTHGRVQHLVVDAEGEYVSLREYAREQWGWSGAAVVTSHGLCPECFRREQAALAAFRGEKRDESAEPGRAA